MSGQRSGESSEAALSAGSWHLARLEQVRGRLADTQRLSGRLAASRLAVALTSAAAALWSAQGTAPPGTGWAAGAGVAVFVALVAWHDRVERRERWHAAAAAWHEGCQHRVARAWDDLPEPWQPAIDPHHPFAHDLDLFGRVSLFELLGPPGTEHGRRVLAGWLLEPAAVEEISARQEAAGELARLEPFREMVSVQARLAGNAGEFDLRGFLEWAEGPSWLGAHPTVRWLARALGAGTPLLVAAQLLGWTETAWWLATVAAGLLLTWTVRRPMERALARATGWEPVFRAYADWLTAVESASFSAARLRRVQERLGAGGRPASRCIAAFQRVVSLADVRRNALLHFPLHALTLWDFHVWATLERWQRRHGRLVRQWLDALADLEALSSLGTLAHDHPDWTWPSVSRSHERFEAGAIGHPLLPPATCVRNDVHVGPAGRVLCLTGSNMSGKSTLLRAIGVNAVLAQAGAPVCAEALRTPPVAVHSSLRVVDSLSEGVSFFRAALEQLRRLVAAADEARSRPADGRRPMYLLDEILQGTNSAERATAVRIVLRHLLATPAIGAITTHDLALTESPELREFGDHVHFRETIDEHDGRIAMTFDYRLRPGVATSRNALALMRLVGLADATEMALPSTGRAGQRNTSALR